MLENKVAEAKKNNPGWTLRQIAEYAGCSHGQVVTILYKLGLYDHNR